MTVDGRARAAAAAGLLMLVITLQAEAQRPTPEELERQAKEIEKKVPELSEPLEALTEAPKPSWGSVPLPKPSLTEPFEIGQALYDPGRLADGVVSMLALMRIGVGPDAGPAAKPDDRGLTLSVSEVRALIDMGTEDLESAGDIENLPYSFADLHRAVAALLPGVSVQQMAESYTRAYQQAPEELIAKALMGQPIEPETKLTRTQIWFLLMDGFAGGSAGGAPWGTADRELPDPPSPNPEWSAAEWREVLARLPLVTATRLVTVSAPDLVTPGATAKPAPATVTLRVNPAAPPLVSRQTGRTLIATRAGSLAGQDVTWRVRDQSALEEIGTITSPTGEPVRVGADGLAHFVFQPGVDATGGTGEPVDAWETVEARFQTGGLMANAYAVPASLAHLPLGSSRARASLHLSWRSSNLLYLMVANFYSGINFEIPGVGGGSRDGGDDVVAKLWKDRRGSYRGWGTGHVQMSQTLSGPNRGRTSCPTEHAHMSQRLYVLATPVPLSDGLGPTKTSDMFLWLDSHRGTMQTTPPDGGSYRVEFFPGTDPDIPAAYAPACVSLIPAGRDRQGFGSTWFIAFNDAQWTTSGQGYGIALTSKGRTVYVDLSGADPLSGDPVLVKLKTALKLTGHSVWYVRAGRTKKDFER
jgi:hypothetical protein